MTEIGDRVGAIQSADETTVQFFGYGVYDGRIDNPDLGFPNPRITLDNGTQVWGYECWWGPEDHIRAKIGSREIVIVPVAPHGT